MSAALGRQWLLWRHDTAPLAFMVGAQLIYAAPCCHQQLQRELLAVSRAARRAPNARMLPAPEAATAREMAPAAASLALLGRDNLIRQRIGDTLTDHLRATLLRLMGYRVEVPPPRALRPPSFSPCRSPG